jgi:hypothetical protein
MRMEYPANASEPNDVRNRRNQTNGTYPKAILGISKGSVMVTGSGRVFSGVSK